MTLLTDNPIWSLALLLVVFCCLICMELFLPTAGMAGVGAVAVMLASLYVAAQHSLLSALVTLIGYMVVTPLIIRSMLKIWPNTPIGRRILNRRPGQVKDVIKVSTLRDGIPLESLVGQTGVALSDLLPGGLVRLGGHRVDCISVDGSIDKGHPVEVTKVSGGKVYVREVDSMANENPQVQTGVSFTPESLEADLE
ncbi:MAG: NfeD family protein [Planctomycetota bacterium]